MTDLTDLVPLEPIANLKWRIRCRERAQSDKGFRKAFQDACFSDPVFFCAAVLWVHEPRSKIKTKPFLPWPHQLPVIRAIDDTILESLATEKPTSITLKKSRAQGGTYVYLATTIYHALRSPGFTVGLVTRNEDTVDSRLDDSAVMFKLAAMLDQLPAWMLPRYERLIKDHVIRLPNGSGWSGYAATGDVARGGRTTVFCFDEVGSEEFVAGNKDFKVLSSVSHVSNCLILCSTFGTDQGVFFETTEDPENERIYALDWKDNPNHSRLAYTMTEGKPVALHPEEQQEVNKYVRENRRQINTIERRGHKIEGKLRSPWYDSHCLLPGATPRFIARELDMDPKGAVGKVFPSDLLKEVKFKYARRPIWQGQPVFDSDTLALKGLIEREGGPLSLWFKPGIDNRPPLGPFTIGCDMATGSDGAYASNSVASALDDNSGEQVLEYVIKGMPLIEFARISIGLAIWLRGALLAWEDSGMSRPYAKEVMEVFCYGHVYYRDVEQLGSQRKSRKPGWPCRDADKATMFERFAVALQNGSYKPRSEGLVTELGEYEWHNGKITHAPTKNKGAKEKNHGDRAVAGAGCWWVFESDAPDIDTDEEHGKIPEYGSFLWRERRDQQLTRSKSGSPMFNIRDVVGW